MSASHTHQWDAQMVAGLVSMARRSGMAVSEWLDRHRSRHYLVTLPTGIIHYTVNPGGAVAREQMAESPGARLTTIH
jgi:hypothetical protein